MKGTINQDAKTLESRANSIRVSAILKKYTMVIALVVVFIFFTALTGGKMLYAQNISNLLLQNAYVLVMGCGMLLCILTGGNVDLSVGATLCLVGAIAAQLMSNTSLNAVLVIIICLAISAVIGTWQGFWIGYMHIPPFICTLAGMFLFRGLGRVVLESKTVSISNKLFLNINAGFITEIFTGFFINQKIKFHGIDVFQGQLSNIIIKNKQLLGIHQGFIQSILNHIKQGLVFLHDGFNGVPGIFHITKVQLEISCQPFQKIRSLQPFFCQSVLVLQVSQLIKSHNINGGAFVPLLLKHKPIKHGGSVNRQLHRITFLEV